MVVWWVLAVWLLGIFTGSVFTAVLLYCNSRQHLFGTLKINLDDPCGEFLTVELNKELKTLGSEKEIILKVERS